MHHTELRSAFDVPLITSSAKPKTFTLWVRGKEIELTSRAITVEYGWKNRNHTMKSSGGEAFSLCGVTQRKGNTVLFVSCFVPTFLLVWIVGELKEMDEMQKYVTISGC